MTITEWTYSNKSYISHTVIMEASAKTPVGLGMPCNRRPKAISIIIIVYYCTHSCLLYTSDAADE